jgi:nucleolar GTP-binding protein
MSVNGLKAITPVPNVNDFLDIILSSVQRKTPTVIHKNVSWSRCDESCFVEDRLAEP